MAAESPLWRPSSTSPLRRRSRRERTLSPMDSLRRPRSSVSESIAPPPFSPGSKNPAPVEPQLHDPPSGAGFPNSKKNCRVSLVERRGDDDGTLREEDAPGGPGGPGPP